MSNPEDQDFEAVESEEQWFLTERLRRRLADEKDEERTEGHTFPSGRTNFKE